MPRNEDDAANQDQLIEQFLAPYEPPVNLPEEQDERLLTAEELHALEEAFVEIVDPLPLADLEQDQREDMKGKRFPEMQEIMFECAEGLERHADLARELGTTPEAWLHAVDQDMAIGGFIKGLQSIEQGLDTGLLLAATEGDRLCQAAQEELLSCQRDPLLDPAVRLPLGDLFAEALRLYAEAQAAAPAPLPLPEEAALKAQEDQQRRRDMVQRLLTDAQAGKAEAVLRGKNK